MNKEDNETVNKFKMDIATQIEVKFTVTDGILQVQAYIPNSDYTVEYNIVTNEPHNLNYFNTLSNQAINDILKIYVPYLQYKQTITLSNSANPVKTWIDGSGRR